jgi:predicted peroxiredoxin
VGALDAGHDAEVFLAGEAVYLVKSAIAEAAVPVAMPGVRELIGGVVAQRVPIYVCGKRSAARGVTEDDLKGKNARFVNPRIFADKVAAADDVVSPSPCLRRRKEPCARR